MSEKPPTIDYASGRSEPDKPVHISTRLGVFIILICIPILFIYITKLNPPPREKANQVKCSSCLKQFGMAIMIYANDNHGAFPPDLPILAKAMPAEMPGFGFFVCPSTPDKMAISPADLSKPGHCSYIYVGAGLTTQSNPECIAAIEDPGNHGLEGANILYADGHVDFLGFPDSQGLPQIMQALNDLSAGKNPPNSITTFTQATAEQDYQKNWKSRMPQLKSGVWLIPSTQPTSSGR